MTVVLLLSADSGASAEEKLDRTSLPIQEPERPTYSKLDVRNAKPPQRFEVKAPVKAPNVVIVLIDDVGFGGPSTFGGPIRTPTLDRLAAAGFHSTALCSPTRVGPKRIGMAIEAEYKVRSIGTALIPSVPVLPGNEFCAGGGQ